MAEMRGAGQGLGDGLPAGELSTGLYCHSPLTARHARARQSTLSQVKKAYVCVGQRRLAHLLESLAPV
jgi:hypothetical protein